MDLGGLVARNARTVSDKEAILLIDKLIYSNIENLVLPAGILYYRGLATGKEG